MSELRGGSAPGENPIDGIKRDGIATDEVASVMTPDQAIEITASMTDADPPFREPAPRVVMISWPGRLLLIILFLWVIGVAFAAQMTSWTGEALGLSATPLVDNLFQVALIALPLLLALWRWRRPRALAMLTAWLWPTLYLLALTPTRLLPPTESQFVLLAQLAISLLFLGLICYLWRDDAAHVASGRWGYPLALMAAALFTYPWLAWGSLGSLLDTLLALALGLVVGLIAARLIDHTWLASLGIDSHGRGRDLFTGGLVIGGMLVVLLSGLSLNGNQLLLMLSVSALGWAAMAVSFSEDGHSWRPPALLIGLAIAAILALVDSDGQSILAMDQLMRWAFRSVGVSILVGWLLGIIAMIGFRNWGQPHNLRVATVGALALWLVGGVLYFIVGQPGFYGDRLFVVLADQADVSAATDMDDYDARRHFVYATLVDHADETQRDLRGALDGFGVDYQPYYLVNALEVNGGFFTRLWLRNRPGVDRILPSPIMRPLPATTLPRMVEQLAPDAPQWNLTNIGADRVWDEFGVRGAGIVIGQSDSGVEWTHPEVRAGYRGDDGDHDYHWLDPWTQTPSPVDYGGHGTHTLGSVMGHNVGVAPDAEWFACANLQRNLGNPARYLDCMQFMLAPHPQNGDPLTDGDPRRAAHVLNNSWGCPEDHEGCDPTALLPAVRALRTAGIFVVASAGNDGPACSTVTDPIAIYDESFSVGAVDRHNDLAPFSSVGPVTADASGRIKPDILAPGMAVLSAIPGDGYAEYDGTSMAGPHVAGVVALLWSANPDLIGDIGRTEQIMIETATPFTGTLAIQDFALPGQDPGDACLNQIDLQETPNNAAGYGIINAYAAVRRALE